MKSNALMSTKAEKSRPRRGILFFIVPHFLTDPGNAQHSAPKRYSSWCCSIQLPSQREQPLTSMICLCVHFLRGDDEYTEDEPKKKTLLSFGIPKHPPATTAMTQRFRCKGTDGADSFGKPISTSLTLGMFNMFMRTDKNNNNSNEDVRPATTFTYVAWRR